MYRGQKEASWQALTSCVCCLCRELGVAVAVTRLALTGPFYTILPVDAFGAIAMRACCGFHPGCCDSSL